MKKPIVITFILGIVCALFTVPSFAAPQSTSGLLGQPVMNEQGQTIGRVHDLIHQNGNIEYAVIDQDGNLVQVPYSDINVRGNNIYAEMTRATTVGRAPMSPTYQEPARGYTATGPAAARPMGEERGSSLIGSTVFDRQGRPIGRVNDIIIRNGQIASVVVDQEGNLVQIPYSDVTVRDGNVYAEAPAGRYAQTLPPAELPERGGPARVAQREAIMNLLNRPVLNEENQQIGRVWDVRTRGNRIDSILVNSPSGQLTQIPYEYFTTTEEGVLKIARAGREQSVGQVGPEVPWYINPNLRQPWFGYYGGSGSP